MASKIKVDQLETADGSGTIALQNQLSGMTDASMPTGSVVQVVNADTGTQVSTTSSSFSDIGLSATITPKYNNSRILVIADISGVTYHAGYSAIGTMQIVRGSTAISLKRFGVYVNAGNDANFYGGVNDSVVDLPNTTSATTYKVQGKNYGGTSVTFQPSAQGNSRLTLMEIAG